MERGSECDIATKERGNTNERAKRTTRAEVATSGAGGGSEMKVRADVATKERGKRVPKCNGRPARNGRTNGSRPPARDDPTQVQ